MNRFKSYGVIALVVALAAVFAISIVSAAPPASEDSEDLNVSVQVASQTWIDISPDHIRWYNVNPGADSTNFTDTDYSGSSTTNHDGIVVRNIGSTNIKTVWFNASYESSLPFGTGTLANYDVANYVLLSKADIDGNSSAQMAVADYYYINKREYPEATRVFITASLYNTLTGRNIPYLQTVYPTAARNVTIGRLRDGQNEYLWSLLENDQGNCNKSATGVVTHPEFRIGLNPSNETAIGDIDLTDGCEVAGTCEQVTSWGTITGDIYYGTLNLDGNRWKGTVVRLDVDCQGVSFVTWNKDLANNQIGNPGDYSANYWLANATSYAGSDFTQGTDLGDDARSSEILAPGEYYTGWLKIRLPWGIPAGTLDTGTITVLAAQGNPNSA